MTLLSFVLAARLEEVAAAASERLLKMTSGRYSLVHTDARRGAAVRPRPARLRQLDRGGPRHQYAVRR